MTRPTVRRRLLSLALAAALTGPVLAQNYQPFTVADIRVDGLHARAAFKGRGTRTPASALSFNGARVA